MTFTLDGFNTWLNDLSCRLFERTGVVELTPIFAVARNITIARELLLCEYSDIAMNSLRNYVWQRSRDKWADQEPDWNDLLGRIMTIITQLVSTKSRHLCQTFTTEAYDMLCTRTGGLIFTAYYEHICEIPPKLRCTARHEAVLRAGHIVVGWEGGYFPEGHWVMW
jgi:hypothetical protein